MTEKPMIYEYSMDIRFADLDSYGHLNSTQYLDLVSTSRLFYMERKVGVPLNFFSEKGIGFYMTKATQEFLKPVLGMTTVHIKSFIQEINGVKLTVPFEMLNVDKTKLHCRGSLEFAVIDLKTQKPTALPDWVKPYFFETTP